MCVTGPNSTKYIELNIAEHVSSVFCKDLFCFYRESIKSRHFDGCSWCSCTDISEYECCRLGTNNGYVEVYVLFCTWKLKAPVTRNITAVDYYFFFLIVVNDDDGIIENNPGQYS
jgi:hypothetical protein